IPRAMRYNNANNSSSGPSCVVRMRGLPFESTASDVVKFFDDCSISRGQQGVHLTQDHLGRPSGEAYVVFETPDDAAAAMRHDKQHMGRRYVELFQSSEAELARMVPGAGVPGPTGRPANSSGGGGAYGGHNREPVLRMRGLPFAADFDGIREFFHGFHVVKDGILMVYNQDGRPSGEAYVQFDTPETASSALSSCNRQNMGSRYIELFPSSMAEAYAEANRQQMMASGGDPYAAGGAAVPPPYGGGYGYDYDYGPQMGDYSGAMASGGGSMRGGRGGPGGYGGARPSPYGGGGPGGMRRDFGGGGGGGPPGSDWASTTGYWVHMRGLPYSASESDIRQFFAPLTAAHVEIRFNPDGRPSGEADVDFDSEADCRRAMEKNKQHLGSRYVDLFLHRAGGGGRGAGGGGPPQLMHQPMHQPGGYRGGVGPGVGDGFRVHLRGLPWSAGEAEIYDFFAPLRPTRVQIGRDPGGRSSGEADAFFQSADEVRQAAEYNGKVIGTRYIEIFTN
ncbi:hypothetical protein BOX15_Mlig028543g1, partial [Macrostomum lignano]